MLDAQGGLRQGHRPRRHLQGLRTFAVSLDPERPALTWLQDGDPADWGMADLEAGPGYAAAVCAAGRGWSLRCFEPEPAG